jgi:hypothetical protein
MKLPRGYHEEWVGGWVGEWVVGWVVGWVDAREIGLIIIIYLFSYAQVIVT